jgi:hypothetical protein
MVRNTVLGLWFLYNGKNKWDETLSILVLWDVDLHYQGQLSQPHLTVLTLIAHQLNNENVRDGTKPSKRRKKEEEAWMSFPWKGNGYLYSHVICPSRPYI